MCEDMNGEHPYHAARAEQLQELCSQLGLDAILLITGWDGCYNLGSKGLVEWLCDKAGSAISALELEDALEEGLFVITPSHVEYHIAHVADDAQLDAAAAAAAVDDGIAGAATSMADPMQISPNPSLTQQQQCCMHRVGSSTGGSLSAVGGASAATAAAGSSNMLAGQAAAVTEVNAPPPDAKLSLLLHLRDDLRRVGVPLGVEVLDGLQQQVDAGRIYKWPLLMALAELAAIQPEQLFEAVVDISPALPALMGVADGTHLCNVLRIRRPLLHKAWTEVMAACWRRSSGPKLDMSEAAVAAPLTEFVSGCGCRLKPGQYMPLALPPRVLFGPRTNQLDALSSSAVTLRALSNQHGTAVLHATVEAADACSALRFARTVFFAQGSRRLQQQQVAGETAGQSQSLTGGDFEVDQADVFDLIAWYTCTLEAAWAAMTHFSTHPSATWESAQAAAAAAATAYAAAAQLPAPTFGQTDNSPAASIASETADGMLVEQPDMQQPQLAFQLNSWTGGPRPMPQQQQQWLQQHNMRFKTLRVLCSGIRSRSNLHQGLLLGSVLYSDTFLDVPTAAGSPAQLVNLTATHCPVNSFNFWGSEAVENTQLVASFRRHLQQQLQQQLQAAAHAQLAQAIQAQVQAQTQRRKSIDNPVGAAGSTTAAAAAGQCAVAGAVAGKSPPSPTPGQLAPAAAQPRSLLPQQDQLMILQQHFQQQQQQQTATGKGNLRRLSMPQEQQLLQLQQLQQQQQLLIQQLAAAGGQQARKQQALLQQQLLMQAQHQQQQSHGKHALNTAASQADTSMKRSCCGGGNTAAAAAAAASTPAGLNWGIPSPPPSSGTLPPVLPFLGSTSGAASPQKLGPAMGSTGSSSSSSSGLDCALVLQQLGQLLLPQGEMPGEIGLVLTGAQRLAVMDGPLYPHQHGLAFISRASKVHILLMDQVEGVWLQDFASQVPGYAAVGPCLVLKGRAPACGLVPATHMTDNTHVAIPLRAMSKVCREHWVSTVLRAWQAATGRVVEARGASAPWPLPSELQPVYRYWLQGPRKRFMVLQPDDAVEALINALDRPKQEQHHLMYDI